MQAKRHCGGARWKEQGEPIGYDRIYSRLRDRWRHSSQGQSSPSSPATNADNATLPFHGDLPRWRLRALTEVETTALDFLLDASDIRDILVH